VFIFAVLCSLNFKFTYSYSMKFSIVTATYNCGPIVLNAIKSVNSQDYLDIEHIVIDGSSKDDTLELLQSNASCFSCLVSEPDSGIYEALNKGIDRATGDVIGILHADDVFVDEHVITSIQNAFDRHSGVDLVIGNVAYVDSEDSDRPLRMYISKRFRLWMFRFGFMPAHTATFIKKSVFDRFGVYRTDFVSAGDFDFFVRTLWRKKVPYVFLDGTIVYMRTGGMSSSGIKSYYRTSIEILRSLRENGVYSNWLFVLLRLPVKLFSQWYYRLKRVG